MPPLAEIREVERREAPRERGRRAFERARSPLERQRGFEPRAVFQPFQPQRLMQNLTHDVWHMPWSPNNRPATENLLSPYRLSTTSKPDLLRPLAENRAETLGQQRINLQPIANSVPRESVFIQISLGFLSFASSIIKPFSSSMNVYKLFITRTAENSRARTQLTDIINRLINALNIVFEQAEAIRYLVLQERRQEAVANHLAVRKLEEKKAKLELARKQLQRQFFFNLIDLKTYLLKLLTIAAT